MKNPILLLLAIFSIMPSFSTERDTTVIFNQKEILIKDSSEIVSVTVYENGNKYNKYYESRHIDGKKQTSWELSESVSFPFSDLISGKKKDKRKRFDPHWSGIGFGFCNAMGRGMKFLDSPTGISLDFSGSFEIFWNFVTIFTPIHRDNWGFITGIGLDWRNSLPRRRPPRFLSTENCGFDNSPIDRMANKNLFAWSAFLFAWPGYRYKDIQQHENQIYCRKRKSTVFQ